MKYLFNNIIFTIIWFIKLMFLTQIQFWIRKSLVSECSGLSGPTPSHPRVDGGGVTPSHPGVEGGGTTPIHPGVSVSAVQSKFWQGKPMKSMDFSWKNMDFSRFSSLPGHLHHFQRIRTPQGLRLWQYKTILFFKIFQVDFLPLKFFGFWSPNCLGTKIYGNQ